MADEFLCSVRADLILGYSRMKGSACYSELMISSRLLASALSLLPPMAWAPPTLISAITCKVRRVDSI